MFERGDMVRNKNTLRTGEVLKTYPSGLCLVRYPIEGDEDRDFEFFTEVDTDLHSIRWLEGLGKLYEGRYAHGKGEWYIPSDTVHS